MKLMVSFEFFTIGVSDRSLHREGQKIRPKLRPVGIALLILEMNKVQHVKRCMKQTKLTSEIS